MAAECVQVNQTKGDLKPQALHGLLNLVVNFKHLLCLAERTGLNEEAWAQLLKKSMYLRENLKTATHLAEEALGGAELFSSLKRVAHIGDVIRSWPEHPKREVVLGQLETYAIDPRIRFLIDKTLSDHSGNLIGLLNLDLRAELVVMLEVQVEQLATQLRAFENCGTPREKAQILRSLNPLDSLSMGQLEQGPQADSVLSVNDFELTVSAVAVLALLKPA